MGGAAAGGGHNGVSSQRYGRRGAQARGDDVGRAAGGFVSKGGAAWAAVGTGLRGGVSTKYSGQSFEACSLKPLHIQRKDYRRPKAGAANMVQTTQMGLAIA